MRIAAIALCAAVVAAAAAREPDVRPIDGIGNNAAHPDWGPPARNCYAARAALTMRTASSRSRARLGRARAL
jgi:hypothetical protein